MTRLLLFISVLVVLLCLGVVVGSVLFSRKNKDRFQQARYFPRDRFDN